VQQPLIPNHLLNARAEIVILRGFPLESYWQGELSGVIILWVSVWGLLSEELSSEERSFCPWGFERGIFVGGQRVWRAVKDYRQARKITHGWRHILRHRAERTSVNTASEWQASRLIDTVPFLHLSHWSLISAVLSSIQTDVSHVTAITLVLPADIARELFLKYGQFCPFPRNLGDTFWKSV